VPRVPSGSSSSRRVKGAALDGACSGLTTATLIGPKAMSLSSAASVTAAEPVNVTCVGVVGVGADAAVAAAAGNGVAGKSAVGDGHRTHFAEYGAAEGAAASRVMV
jgi:hypothetical protein